jgi:Lrp/AsnC family leucine-responsive transcriptional regulator
VVLEEIDGRIVAELARDGRCSYTDLADRVGLSVSAAHQRVRRLEQRGVIRGYSAQLDGAQIGLPITAFVSLTPIDPAAPDDYPQRIADLPEVEACYSVAGVESYIVKVRVASPAALESLLTQIRATAGLSTRTTVVLSTPYENRPVTPPVDLTGTPETIDALDSADDPLAPDGAGVARGF